MFFSSTVEYLLAERPEIILAPSLGQGMVLLQHRGKNYLLRHNEVSQPLLIGRQESGFRKRGDKYKVDILPVFFLPEKDELNQLLAPYRRIEARSGPIIDNFF